MTRTVIVTDGEQRAALAAVRDLGRDGWRVVVASAQASCLSGASRFAAMDVQVPDPLAEPDGSARALAALAHSERAELLIPVAEPSLFAVLERASMFSHVALPFAGIDAARAVADKALLMQRAPEAGIAVPAQVSVATPTGSTDRAIALRFPVVLKPSRSISIGSGSRHRFSVSYARDADELTSRLALLPADAYPILVQEYIDGPGIGVFMLLWDGACAASFGHRRLLEKPPSGGVSVYREAVCPPDELMARSRRLLELFGWHGVAMVEFKLDRSTGTPYLMEINGRFWGSLQLAVSAGVRFPTMLARLATGRPPLPPAETKYGVRSRWTLGCVDHLLALARRQDSSLRVGAAEPTFLTSMATIGASLLRPGDRDEVLQVPDPWPAMFEVRRWLRGQ